MLNFDSQTWKEALEKDPKLKKLAINAGCENNEKRAKELNGCYAWNCGRGVVRSPEEEKLARYMFCKHEPGWLERGICARMKAAHEAGFDDL